MQQMTNCYGQPFAPHPVGSAFNTFVNAICQSTWDGLTTLGNPGQTSVQAGWQADSWISWGGGGEQQCQYSLLDVLREALCSVAPAVTYKTASIPGAQDNFAAIGSNQTANLTATENQCNPRSNFVLTVTFWLPQETREVFEVTMEGFGNTSVSEWHVDQESVSHSTNLSVTPRRGDVIGTVNNKNGGQTGTIYNAIQVNVKGKYNSGQTFSTLGTVRINCP